jgi:hypothetical protein
MTIDQLVLNFYTAFDKLGKFELQFTRPYLEAISNKLLRKPQVLTDAATIAWDAASSNHAQVTLTASRIFGAPTNIADGQEYTLEVIQGGSGSYTITWNAAFVWPGGTAPTLTITVGRRDVFRFIGTNGKLVGSTVGLNYNA